MSRISVRTWILLAFGLSFSGTSYATQTPVNIAASGNGFALQIVGGTVWAWGNNSSGQLGDNTFVNHALATPVSGLTLVIAVAAGSNHSLALKTDGTVWAWGANFSGQLGDGTFNSHPTPQPVPGLANIVAIAAGQGHNLALKNDGTLWAWGANFNGQVGNNTSGNSVLSPVAVTTTGFTNNITAIAAGANHSLAIVTGGAVWAWGQNTNGQLGVGTTADKHIPTAITLCTVGAATAIAGGASHSLAVVGGTVCAWGLNGSGQLGDNSATQRTAPVATIPALTGITAVAGGISHSLALKNDGTVWAFGSNFVGALGDGTTTDHHSPAQSTGITNAIEIAAGNGFSVARLSSPADSLLTWGAEGALGDGISNIRPVPIPISGLTGVSQASAGNGHTLALLNGGTVMALGSNSNGQLGDGSQTRRLAPVAVLGLTNITAISAGNTHSLARKGDGTAWGWGNNVNGQVGDGTTGSANNNKPTPVQVVGVGGTGFLTNVAAVSASGTNNHSLAVDNNGVVYAWGLNSFGQLGDNTQTNHPAPVVVGGLSGVFITAVSAGNDHSLALRADGTVWAWGDNANGQLGLGTPDAANHFTPAQVPGLTGVMAISAGNQNSFAFKSDGSIWAWGSNNAVPGIFQQSSPLVDQNLPAALSLAAGNGYTLFTIQIGSFKRVGGWGLNNNGQLGTGTFDYSSVGVPTLGFAGKTPGSVSANGHSLAVMTDGSVWGWGLDNNGQLGDSPTIFNATPTAPVARGVADLTVTKTHVGSFSAGSPGTYTITVKNVGLAAMSGTITVTDTLPAGMSFVSGVGTGWTCGAISGGASCTNPGPLAAGASSVITLNVNTTALMFPEQFNLATVGNASDVHALNNVSGDDTSVSTPTAVTLTPAPSPNPSTYGQPVSLTATVTPSTASGYVVFGDIKDSGTYLGAVPVSAGTAHISTIALAPGVRQLEAVFVPDPSSPYAISLTAPTSQTVNAVPSATLTPMASSPLVLGGSHVGYLVANADFNADGKMDIAVVDPGSHAVTVYLGNGNGGFTPSIGGPFPTGISPVAIVAVDLNRDGKVDLAIANQGGLNAVTVLLGNGAGGFAAAPGSPFAVFFSPTSIAVSDFNNDGTPRLAAVGLASAQFAKFKRDTFGNFFVDTFTVPSGSRSGVASADFNGDGIADLAFSDTAGSVGISLKDPNGGYIPLVSIPSTLPHPQGIVTADISGDGKPDLIVYDATGIELLIGNGSGGFAEAAGSPFVPGTGPITGISSVSVGDFNGDGKPDLFVVRIPTSTSKGEVLILRGDGSGHFALPGSAYASLSSNFQNAVVAEFNGDGRTDVAVTDPGNDGVVVLRGTPGPIDFDGNGVADLVWQNDSSRQVAVWYMGGAQGNTYQSWTWLSAGNMPGWTLVGAVDLNGDSHPDLIWQNDSTRQVAIWYMGGAQGNTYQSWTWLSAGNMPGWTLVGAVDLNGDSHPDLIWQNDSTRQVAVWYMGGAQGNTYQSWTWLSAGNMPGWTLVGAVDLNGDSHPDLIWQNDSTRQVAVWYMGGAQGNTYQSWTWLSAGNMPGWTLVGAVDLNGDSHPDLIWQNDSTRQVAIWYMGGAQGNTYQSWAWLSAGDMPGWRALSH